VWVERRALVRGSENERCVPKVRGGVRAIRSPLLAGGDSDGDRALAVLSGRLENLLFQHAPPAMGANSFLVSSRPKERLAADLQTPRVFEVLASIRYGKPRYMAARVRKVVGLV
jgi:hypothetical protein